MTKAHLSQVDYMHYTAHTIVLFTNTTGDIIKGASPWRDMNNNLRVTITPKNMRIHISMVTKQSIISFFDVESLEAVDEILKTNFQPRKSQEYQHLPTTASASAKSSARKSSAR